MQYESIFPARFLARPNRFTALCRLEDGADIVCHVRNTGRCAELFRPGCRVWVQHNPSPTRKTAWTLITVDKDGVLVNVDSLAPNKLFAEAVTKGILVPASLSRVEQMQPRSEAGLLPAGLAAHRAGGTALVRGQGCDAGTGRHCPLSRCAHPPGAGPCGDPPAAEI